MDFSNKKVLVIGTGVSGVSAASLLVKHNAKVVLYDENENASKQGIREKLPGNASIEMITGSLSDDAMIHLDLVVISPGVPMDSPLVTRLRGFGLPIWGEIELAYVLDKGRIVAITGTNGKTTTTALTGKIMKSFYDTVFVVGNIGEPYTGIVDHTSKESVTVSEISSFQLESVHTFRPQVSAILNVTPDHLDRHHTMEEYVLVKKRIAMNQTRDQICVLNYEDPVLKGMANELPVNVIFFSSQRELEEGVYLDESSNITLKYQKDKTVVCNTSELQVLGVHSYENVMAAIAIGVGLQVPMDRIRTVIKQFQAIAHRIEFVAEKNGVKYYNDSKGTNPDAAIKGIQAMVSPTWLIGGGYDKNAGYDEWIESFHGKVKKLVLLGSTKEKIAETAKRHNFYDYVFVKDLEEAVSYCGRNAGVGDAVLLSPACASWDMFKSYEERGDLFKEYVKAL